jgi:hypothetical protein
MFPGKILIGNRIKNFVEKTGIATLLVVVTSVQSFAYEAISVINGGSVTGKITLNGAIPSPKEFDLEKFPQPKFCGTVDNDGKGHRLLFDVSVGQDGALSDVIVSIDNIEKGKPFKFDGTDTNADVCRFLVQGGPSKFVGVARKKAAFRVKNLDADPTDPKMATGVLHNPHLYEELGSTNSTIFNLPLPEKGQEINKLTILRKKGSMLHLQCDQHNYMNSYYYPVDNPYYAIVGEEGTFTIDGIPPGNYELHAWHPILGSQTTIINILPGKEITQNFGFGGFGAAGTNNAKPKTPYNTVTGTTKMNPNLSDKTNNSQAPGITLYAALPDLEMTSITPNSAAVDAGATLSVTDGVINRGSAFSDGFTIAYLLSVDTPGKDSDYIVLPSTRKISPLAPGRSSEATTNLTIPATIPANVYHVCAKVDSENNLRETSEESSILCSTTQVIVRRSDLIVSSITTTATIGTAGRLISLNLSVKNQGDAPAGSSVESFYFSTNAVYGNKNDFVSTTTKEFSSLNPGATSSGPISVLIPENTPAGSYYLCAKADSKNTVAESNEDNNTDCTSISFKVPLPDIVMTKLSTSTATVRSGKSFTLLATLRNRGGSAPSAFEVGFVLSKNTKIGDEDDIGLAPKMSLNYLRVGGSSSGTIKVAVPVGTSPGVYHVGTIVDANKSATEGESRRLSPAKITVIP